MSLSGLRASNTLQRAGWETAETPTGNTLHGVEYTTGGAYAVGGGGIVLERASGGWTKVLDGGPTGSNNLYGADATFENGETGTWDSATPGSGSNTNALDFFDARRGHAVDGNKTVFVTSDGTTWDKLGIADANSNFYGVDSDGTDDVTVSGGGGVVWNWNGSEWRRDDTGDASLRDVEVGGTPGLTVGGGKVFRRDDSGWVQEATSTGDNLEAVFREADHDIGVTIPSSATYDDVDCDADDASSTPAFRHATPAATTTATASAT